MGPGSFWSVLGELLSTVARGANKGHANLELILASKEELARELKGSVSLGCHYPEIVGSRFPKRVKKENRRLQMPGIRAAGFGLFWAVLVEMSWSAALKGSRAQCSWSSTTASSKLGNGLYQNSIETCK